MTTTSHGLETSWRYFQTAIERYGWHFLGLSVLVYVLRQRYSAYATRMHMERTLREANDPDRVAVLRKEAARVREQQQQRLKETLPVRKPKAKPS